MTPAELRAEDREEKRRELHAATHCHCHTCGEDTRTDNGSFDCDGPTKTHNPHLCLCVECGCDKED